MAESHLSPCKTPGTVRRKALEALHKHFKFKISGRNLLLCSLNSQKLPLKSIRIQHQNSTLPNAKSFEQLLSNIYFFYCDA